MKKYTKCVILFIISIERREKVRFSKIIASLLLSASLLLCGCGNGAKTDNISSDTTSATSEITTAEPETPAKSGEMRDITVQALVAEMHTGWNLGNTFDALGGETAWGNPYTTKEMIDFVAGAGFDVIRIPTTWGEKMDENDKIPDEWINRVQEVVDYALDSGMYVILNSHHETSWIKPATDQLDSFMPKFEAMWTQIAEKFKDYGDHLLFEGLNEPRIEGGKNEWGGGTKDGRAALNVLNAKFVEVVRNSGGNNEKRALLITSFAAAVSDSALKGLEIPEDDRILISLHAYTPYNYTYHPNSDWEVFEFGDQVGADIDNVFNTIDEYFISKNIPVIITEYGSVSKNFPGSEERNDAENVKWVNYYLNRARNSGIPCIWWDNGNYYGSGERFGILDRRNLKWYVPDLVKAIADVYY